MLHRTLTFIYRTNHITTTAMLKEKFFGRKEFLAILEKRTRALKDGYRQNIAMIGDELVGKTSIVFQFLSKFYDNGVIPVYLEVRAESLQSFSKRFIAVLLYNFLTNSGIELKEDLDFLIKKSEPFIPNTLSRIKSLLSDLEKKRKENIFTELLSLCETIYSETGKRCVVIFDEFHHLGQLGAKKLYTEWSKLLITQKNTMYIIMSSLIYKTKAILSKELSLLFGNFEVLTVEPFDISTSESYLENRLTDLTVDGALKNFIVHFTGGYPFYLEVISEALLKSNRSDSDLVDCLEELLFSPSGALHQRFSNYLKRFQDDPYTPFYLSILHLISDGHNTIRDIAHILRKTRKELDPRINHLLGLDAIYKSGDFFMINDRVFSFWLKFVYQEKLNSLTFDAKSQLALFRHKIEGMIQEFIVQANKPVNQRIMELLYLFQDEQVQLERKKFRLNHFREIKPLEFNNISLKDGLICRSSDSTWIIGFKYDFLSEQDIAEFSKECKKYRHKLQKKIIVTLQDIDANSRLRALEEKITTWNIKNINQILDLFSKPRIII